MAVDIFGNWDGVCACGKKELDGITCRFGATHLTTFSDAKSLAQSTTAPVPSFPWTQPPELLPSNGPTKMPWET